MVERCASDGGWWSAVPRYGAGIDDNGGSGGPWREERGLRWERGGSCMCAKSGVGNMMKTKTNTKWLAG